MTEFERAMLALTAVLVEDVRALRDLVTAALTAPTPDEQFVAGCQHPDDSRVDLSTPNDRNHWVCKECRFDNKATA